jgi:DNA excision repair protein ERCC-6
MWALYDYIFEGELLGDSKSFKNNFSNAITRSTQKDATDFEKKKGDEISKKLRKIIEPYFLRREKGVVLKDKNISKKNDMIVWLNLTEHQIKLYRREINPDNIRDLMDRSRVALEALTTLKQLCNHPLLLERDNFENKYGM